MDTYNLNENSTFIIYGASHQGRNIKASLDRQGYKIECFLDEKYYRVKQIDELSVCNPEEIKCGDYVYIIVKNNPHSFANLLFEKGVRKIIYNPLLYSRTDNDYINGMVNAFFMIENVIDSKINIPYYNPEFMDDRFVDASFIRYKGDETLAYIPTDLLFEKNNRKHFYIKYADLIESFKEMDGRGDGLSNIEKYIESYSLTKLTNRRFDRTSDKLRYIQEQFNCYNMRLNCGMDWFINNPIKVIFDDNRFLIENNDVFHVAFLIAKGIFRIPALISKEEYFRWINAEKLLTAVHYAKTKKMLVSYTPLEHPYFYNFPIARDIGGNSRIITICKWLMEEGIEIENKSVIDMGAYYGFFSRFFSRLGAKVTLVEANENSFGFCKQLNELMRLNSINMYCGEIEKLEETSSYDICLLLTVLYWYYKDTIGLRILNVVDRVTKGALLWESGDQIEEEKEWIMSNSSFKHYKKIAKTIGTGKIRELGVFWK